MTFAELKVIISDNLADAGAVFFNATDLTNSVQDAYDDIAFQSHCIVKKTPITFPQSAYLKVTDQVSDFIGTTAIFNRNTNRWLNDCVTLRDFDKIRTDWELWTGTPQFWAAQNFERLVILPYYSVAPNEVADLIYIAKAPTVVDASTPLIHTNFQSLIENYCTADLLEQAEEFVKASGYWKLYVEGIEEYRSHVKLLAKRDLILTA